MTERSPAEIMADAAFRSLATSGSTSLRHFIEDHRHVTSVNIRFAIEDALTALREAGFVVVRVPAHGQTPFSVLEAGQTVFDTQLSECRSSGIGPEAIAATIVENVYRAMLAASEDSNGK